MAANILQQLWNVLFLHYFSFTDVPCDVLKGHDGVVLKREERGKVTGKAFPQIHLEGTLCVTQHCVSYYY